jgi:diguanylate cyclase (GGDEF)-like protein
VAVPTDSPFDPTRAAHAFRSRAKLNHTLPFLAVAVAAELSLALPPGPASYRDTWISVALLALTAGCFLLPWDRLPRWADVTVPLCYVGSSLALILAAGGSSAGVGLVVLLPILWAALNLELWKSLVVVGAVVVIEFVTTYTPIDLSDSVRLRREVAFLAIGGLTAYAVHDIRTRITSIAAQREAMNDEMTTTISALNEQNRSTSILGNLVEMLNFCDVIEEAFEVFDYTAREIFDVGGSICFMNPLSQQLEMKCSWLDYGRDDSPFLPELCRALRQGQPYESNNDNPPCDHLRDSRFPHTLCQPLLIQRDVIGVLTVAIPDDRDAARPEVRDSATTRHYARLLGDQISIWMANFTLRESLRALSIRDPLTNLFNRRFMIETLQREMSITNRSNDETSIIQIDIDHFKSFNDSFGHEVGDSVLRCVADVMLGLFRESDVPCRSGGEEFTLILPRCSWDIAYARAVELQHRVADMRIPVPSNQPPLRPPTLSIGIATSPEHGVTGDELLRGADVALYSAKAAGRNQVVRALPVDLLATKRPA